MLRTGEYFAKKLGAPDGILTLGQWMSLPEHALAEAVNGALFYDGCGEVTAIRERLRRYPIDVRRKKLAGNMMLMAQAGLYNYARCLGHGEAGAAQLAVIDFADRAMAAVFLLNETYRPFYKWRFRAMRHLTRLSLLAELLEYLVTTGNEPELAEEKQRVMAGICRDVIAEAVRQGLSRADSDSLEAHARSVNDAITDPALRNADILAGAE